MAKVISKAPQIVSLGDMEDGDMAEVVKWHRVDLKPGDLIMRHKDMIIVLGEPCGESYTSILETECAEENKVIILEGEVTISI